MSKVKEAKKLFYNKFGYKITLRMRGAVYFRIHGTPDTFKINESNQIYSWQLEAFNNKEKILLLDSILKKYDKSFWKIRVERNLIDIYSTEKDMIVDIESFFEDSIYHIYKPSETISEEKNVVNCKKLPHNKFVYKVFLTPHKIRDRETKRKLVEWVRTTPGFSMTLSVSQWFITTDWNWDRRYMWVENSQSLLMLKLRSADAVGTVHEYRIIDK